MRQIEVEAEGGFLKSIGKESTAESSWQLINILGQYQAKVLLNLRRVKGKDSQKLFKGTIFLSQLLQDLDKYGG